MGPGLAPGAAGDRQRRPGGCIGRWWELTEILIPAPSRFALGPGPHAACASLRRAPDERRIDGRATPTHCGRMGVARAWGSLVHGHGGARGSSRACYGRSRRAIARASMARRDRAICSWACVWGRRSWASSRAWGSLVGIVPHGVCALRWTARGAPLHVAALHIFAYCRAAYLSTISLLVHIFLQMTAGAPSCTAPTVHGPIGGCGPSGNPNDAVAGRASRDLHPPGSFGAVPSRTATRSVGALRITAAWMLSVALQCGGSPSDSTGTSLRRAALGRLHRPRGGRRRRAGPVPGAARRMPSVALGRLSIAPSHCTEGARTPPWRPSLWSLWWMTARALCLFPLCYLRRERGGKGHGIHVVSGERTRLLGRRCLPWPSRRAAPAVSESCDTADPPRRALCHIRHALPHLPQRRSAPPVAVVEGAPIYLSFIERERL
jgi:hypothetical protein